MGCTVMWPWVRLKAMGVFEMLKSMLDSESLTGVYKERSSGYNNYTQMVSWRNVFHLVQNMRVFLN